MKEWDTNVLNPLELLFTLSGILLTGSSSSFFCIINKTINQSVYAACEAAFVQPCSAIL